MRRKSGNARVLYSLRLDRRQLAELRRLAAQREVTTSELCRQLLAANANGNTAEISHHAGTGTD